MNVKATISYPSFVRSGKAGVASSRRGVLVVLLIKVEIMVL